MQKLILTRLESEIGQCRKFASTTAMELEQIKHELNLTNGSVETGKHDLAEQEIHLEKLVGRALMQCHYLCDLCSRSNCPSSERRA